MKRPCAEAGCPRLTRETRCVEHERARDKARGTRQQRGYGSEHDQRRAYYQRRMDSGERFRCWRCGETIDPTLWDLGHKPDRTLPSEPQCYCNRATAARIPGG